MFHLMFVHYTFSSVLVAGEIATHSVGHLYLLYLSICILFISHFCFKSECHHNARARGDQPGFRR